MITIVADHRFKVVVFSIGKKWSELVVNDQLKIIQALSAGGQLWVSVFDLEFTFGDMSSYARFFFKLKPE